MIESGLYVEKDQEFLVSAKLSLPKSVLAKAIPRSAALEALLKQGRK